MSRNTVVQTSVDNRDAQLIQWANRRMSECDGNKVLLHLVGPVFWMDQENKCAMWECLWSYIASGPTDQGKQCSESHLPGWQRRRYVEGTWGVGGGGNALNKHMEKQIFPLPAAVSKGKCQHAPRPRLTVLHSAPPPGSPCSATEYGQEWHCGACPRGSLNDQRSTPPHPALYKTHKCQSEWDVVSC